MPDETTETSAAVPVIEALTEVSEAAEASLMEAAALLRWKNFTHTHYFKWATSWEVQHWIDKGGIAIVPPFYGKLMEREGEVRVLAKTPELLSLALMALAGEMAPPEISFSSWEVSGAYADKAKTLAFATAIQDSEREDAEKAAKEAAKEAAKAKREAAKAESPDKKNTDASTSTPSGTDANGTGPKSVDPESVEYGGRWMDGYGNEHWGWE